MFYLFLPLATNDAGRQFAPWQFGAWRSTTWHRTETTSHARLATPTTYSFTSNVHQINRKRKLKIEYTKIQEFYAGWQQSKHKEEKFLCGMKKRIYPATHAS